MTTEHTTETVKSLRVAGFLAQYDSPAAVMHAAEQVRDAGYTKWDVHSPFPVHGMDGAMGLKSTPMGWISLAGGLTGGSAALLMQWWMNGYDYPLNIGGKPAFAVQAFIPITFELTVLLCAFATLFGMLGLNRLPQLYHWAFSGKTFGRATDDLFFVSIDAEDPKFDREITKKLLDKTHPALLEEIEEEVIEGSDALRKNVGITVEAIAGISSPFKDKAPPAKEEEAVPATAKSTPPPADKAKEQAHELLEAAKASLAPVDDDTVTKAETPVGKSMPPPAVKSEPPKKAESVPPKEAAAKSEPPKAEESKPAEGAEAKKDEPEAPKGGTEKS